MFVHPPFGYNRLSCMNEQCSPVLLIPADLVRSCLGNYVRGGGGEGSG